MGKGTHFFGQPVYGQLIKCLNKDKIVEMSRNHGGERYIKSFDGRQHIVRREARWSEKFFEDVYRDLYDANRETLFSDIRRKTRRYNKGGLSILLLNPINSGGVIGGLWFSGQ